MVWKAPNQGDNFWQALGGPGCKQPPADTAGPTGSQTTLPGAAPCRAQGAGSGSFQTNLAHFLFPSNAPPKTYSLDNIPEWLLQYFYTRVSGEAPSTWQSFQNSGTLWWAQGVAVLGMLYGGKSWPLPVKGGP